MSPPENDPDLKDRVIRLMGFLRKLAIKRSTPVLHVENHPDLLWMSDVERHLPLDVEVAPGGDVFVVPKVQVTAEPELPETLHGWLDRPARGQEPRLALAALTRTLPALSSWPSYRLSGHWQRWLVG